MQAGIGSDRGQVTRSKRPTRLRNAPDRDFSAPPGEARLLSCPRPMRSRLLPSCLLAGLALAATAPLWGTRGSPAVVSLLDPEAVPASPGSEEMPPDGEHEELREAGASARTLAPIPAQEITLRILDEDDEPIPRARARLWSGWPGTSTLLDSFEGEPDGRLVIRFPEAPPEAAASQRIRIEASGRSPQTWTREAFIAEWRDSVCEEEEPPWCPWLPRGSSVEGVVVGADGEPLEGVDVCLDDECEATSDRDGHYALAIPAGFSPAEPMNLSASKEGVGRSLLVLHDLPITGRLPTLCIRSRHSIKGRVSVIPNIALTGWTVSCRLDEAYDDGVEDGTEKGIGPIDDGGHFEVRGLEAGTYSCWLEPPDGAGPDRRARVEVPGFASTRSPLDIHLQVVHVHVEVTQPLKGLEIKVFRRDDLKHPVLTNKESNGEIDEELLLPVGMGLRLRSTLGALTVAEARWTVTADPGGDSWSTKVAPEEKLAVVRVVFHRGTGVRQVPPHWIPALKFYDPRSTRWIEAVPLGDDDPMYWMALPVGDHLVMLETAAPRKVGCYTRYPA
ncbi:MAG: carboxypeptidase-like regulatory domain-containing protein [Planctomycetota bacterium]